MLGGSWFNKLLTDKGELPTLDTVAGVAKAAVISQLGFPHDLQPSKADVFLLKVRDTYYFVKPLRSREGYLLWLLNDLVKFHKELHPVYRTISYFKLAFDLI